MPLLVEHMTKLSSLLLRIASSHSVICLFVRIPELLQFAWKVLRTS
uniref:Uncharacterized protein n=1 Tax=Arundo donax TaxID=35708 RepID=A0A0A9ERM1_ARUDO